MAQQFCLSSPSLGVSRCRAFRNNLSKVAEVLLALDAALLGAVSVSAQTPPQQQYVYASTATSEIAAFSKDPGTGALTLLGSPFRDPRFHGGPMAIDGQGRFLFVIDLTTSYIWMLQIDPDSGNLTNANPLASPFAGGPAGANSLATEKSGHFLYVGYSSGIPAGHGTIIEYSINATDPMNPQLIPQGSTDIPSAPIALLIDPQGYLYVGLHGSGGQGGTNVYSIATGPPQPPPNSSAPGSAGSGFPESAIAIDPRGQVFFDGWGSGAGFIEGVQISPVDGTAVPVPTKPWLSLNRPPSAMLVESSGEFLYVQQSDAVVAYSFDSTGTLTPAPPQAPTLTLTLRTADAAADPQGPYIYSLQPEGIRAFKMIDPETGMLSEVGGSPFRVAQGSGVGLAISRVPVQAASGPAAQLFPPSKDFGTIVIGQSSGAQIMSLTNTGNQPLAVNPVGITGADPGDFTAKAAPSCQMPTVLPPNTTCNITIVFVPTSAGLRQATLSVNDTAGVQSSQLTGTGVAPQPAVTLMPGSLSFPTIAQGATSASQTVTVASSGAATLHISAVLLSGANPGDFTIVTNGCNGAYQVNTSCVISVTFSPFGDGLRTANISIADDAPNSPQSVQLSGTGTGQPVSRPALTIAPGTVFFPTVTQGLTSGPQKVTLTSAGSAPLHISLVLLGGANRDDFSIPNDCTAPAYAPNATCTINVTFAPLMSGPRAATATISITDDASGSPQTLSINGNVAPAFTVTPSASGSLSATVTAGQTAAYNLQVIPAPDFVGSISFSCTGAPLAATCTVPQPLQLNGSAVPFTVRVATTGSGTMASFFRAPRLTPFPGLRILPLLTLFVLVLLVCSMYGNLRRNAPGRRMIYSGLSAVWIVIALFDVAGCGGGSSAAQSAPITQPVVTPQGTSTISVTLTATTASGKQLAPAPPVQLTLTVK